MIRFRLKSLLSDRGMTQKELAAKTGIRPPTISAIATNSIKELPIGVLNKICYTLDCTVEELIVFSRDEN